MKIKKTLKLVEGMARKGYRALYMTDCGTFRAVFMRSQGSSYHWSVSDTRPGADPAARCRTLAECQEQVSQWVDEELGRF